MTILGVYRLFRNRMAHLLVLSTFFGALLVAQEAQAREMNFRVWAGDREIGTHTFNVETRGTTANVLSRAFYNVKVLFVNVFSYEHTASEIWEGDCLASLSSQTVENGKQTTVDARRQADRFAVTRDAQPLLETEDCVGTYAYWDQQRLQRSALMNSQTGEINTVQVNQLGNKPLPRLGEPAPAVEIDSETARIRLWYSEDGEWLALETEAEDQPILYLNEKLL